MNYEESIIWISSFEKYGMKLGLDRISYICKKLGNPQNNYKIIHVGGTNGKGSVCKFLGSILSFSGFKVGIYISPHLQRFSERFVINNKEISKSDISSLVEKIKPIVEDMNRNGDNPTYFEILTAMAFQYFNDQKVEFAVIEVGLGGRFDATNIVQPILTIITNVSLEHQVELGKSLEKIAYEKAGIIKKDIPVITASKKEALNIVKNRCKETNSNLIIIDNKKWKRLNDQEFIIKGFLKDYKIKPNIKGFFQGENIALSIFAIENLHMNGVFIPDENIIEGIKIAENPGRMEIISNDPFILLDGAHNISGISALKKTIKTDFTYDKIILIIGILSDKNIEEMLEIIIPLADTIITTKSDNKRAIEPIILKEKIKKINQIKNVTSINQIQKAIDYAKDLAKKDDLILISGSLFTVGNAREYLLKNKEKLLN